LNVPRRPFLSTFSQLPAAARLCHRQSRRVPVDKQPDKHSFGRDGPGAARTALSTQQKAKRMKNLKVWQKLLVMGVILMLPFGMARRVNTRIL
jgi:hypothetical protein